ncbi:MAG: hypothetical protein J0H78_08740 [Rhizobiales bacterium]|nr:hypothetical protein [Hyphomicrobiales bacterium]OJY45641.1 MAG: hypothetical protein BGP08_18115 [Rhizobiales bacterium 64-17]
MAKRSIPPSALTGLLEQCARMMHSLGFDQGLFPAQWSALRYFAHAEPSHCTAIHLARFQGLAFGPVSRTVRTLITKGLLAKAGSAGRGRAELIKVTARGQTLLKHDPLNLVAAAVTPISEKEKEVLASALEAVLRALHARHEPNQEKAGKRSPAD